MKIDGKRAIDGGTEGRKGAITQRAKPLTLMRLDHGPALPMVTSMLHG